MGLIHFFSALFTIWLTFKKFISQAKIWKKKWLGISPIVGLHHFLGLNTPLQCIMDYLVDFEKIFTASKKLKKFTRYIANRRPQLFFLPKYASPVHYWSFGWFFKNLYREQKTLKIYSVYHQSSTSTIFLPKYASSVHYLSFGWFLKNLYQEQKIEKPDSAYRQSSTPVFLA